MADAAHTERHHDLQWYHCIVPSAAVHVLIVYAWVAHLPEINDGTFWGDLSVPAPGIEIAVNWEPPAVSKTEPAIQESFDPFEETEETVQGPTIRLFAPAPQTEPEPQNSSETAELRDTTVNETQPDSDRVHETQQVEVNTGAQDTAQSHAMAENPGTQSTGASHTGETTGSQGHGQIQQTPQNAGIANGQPQPDEAEIWRTYTKLLSAHFKKYKHYPEMARKQRLTGTVIVSIEIRSDGTIDDVQIEQSSGTAMLDQAAVQSVRRASPTPPFPGGVQAKSRKVTIPYRYQITDG